MKSFRSRIPMPVRTKPAIVLLLMLAAVSGVSLAQNAAANPPPKPPPDVIVFSNGDRLTGLLERAVGGSVVFKSDVAGEVTVPLDKITELRSSGRFAVLRSDRPISRKPEATGTLALGDKALTVAGPSGAPETVPTEKIAYIIDQATYEREMEKKPGLLFGWNGAVNGGATIVRATDYGETYTAGLALVRALPTVPWLPARNRTSFDLQETYGKLTSPVIPQTAPASPAAVTVTSIFHADAERDEYFSPRFFALAQTAFDHNYAQGLSLQQLYGGGIGWTAIKSGKQELDLKATIQFEKQDFQTAASNKNLIGSTLAEAYHRNLPRKLVFSESLNVLPAFNNSSAYSTNVSAGLAMPVYKRLSLTIGANNTFLNDPSAGYQKNSFQFVTAASYVLK
ncbi:MAG: DUF481 domain-containing protein [Acidobacteriaceae bacterium]|jgi:hypothetical protein